MKFLRYLGVVCAVVALLQGTAYGATVTVSTADALWAALKAAAPGDVVQLADGTYPALNLYSNDQYPLFVKASPGVTVMPALGAHPVLAGLSLTGAQGLTFRGLDVQMTPTQQYGVFVGQSGLIVLDGLIIHQADGSRQGVGVFARESHDVTVSNSELHHLGVGVSAMDTVRPLVTTSRFHDIETDGVDLAGDPGARVAFNSFTDFRPVAGDHPDDVQSWGTAANPLPAGLIVEDNVMKRGLGDPTLPPQGVFVADQAQVTIRKNAISCSLYNGISLSNVQTALIEINWDQGCSDFGSRIIVRGGSDSVTVRGNWVSQPIVNLVQAGEPVNTNFTDGGQTTIPGIVVPPAGTAPDTTAMDLWIAANIGTPVPAPTPLPTVDPTVALNAQIASLTAQVTTLTGQVTTLTGQLAAAQTKITALRTSESQIKTLAAQGKATASKWKNGYFDQITSNASAALALP